MNNKSDHKIYSKEKILLVFIVLVYILVPMTLIGLITKFYPSPGSADFSRSLTRVVIYSAILGNFIHNFRALFWFVGSSIYTKENFRYLVRYFLFESFIPSVIVTLLTLIIRTFFLKFNAPAGVYLMIWLLFGFFLSLIIFPPRVLQAKLAGDSTTDAPPPKKKKD